MNDFAIALAEPNDTTDVQALWRYCFDDDESFIQWYFGNYYQNQNTVVVHQEERLVASAQMIPYTIKLRKKELPIVYIVGVATAPEARGQGLGRRILLEILVQMRKRGKNLSLLMPFEGSFYYPYGWEFCYFHRRYMMELEELKRVSQKYGRLYAAKPQDWSKLAQVYEQFVQDKHGYVLRNEQNWQHWLSDCHLDGAWVYILEHERQPEGYISYYFEQTKIVVKEIAYTNHAAKRGLLNFLYNHRSHKKTLHWSAPENDDTVFWLMSSKECAVTYPFLTARIVDAAALLTQLVYPNDHETIIIQLADALAAWNNGYFAFTVHNGYAEVTPVAQQTAQISLDIGALSLLVFGAASAEELVYWNRMTVSAPQILISFSRLWPKQLNYINEYY